MQRKGRIIFWFFGFDKFPGLAKVLLLNSFRVKQFTNLQSITHVHTYIHVHKQHHKYMFMNIYVCTYMHYMLSVFLYINIYL